MIYNYAGFSLTYVNINATRTSRTNQYGTCLPLHVNRVAFLIIYLYFFC